MIRSRTIILIVVPFVLAAGFWFRRAQPPESPRDRANRICQACGLNRQEVNRLIDEVRHAMLTGEEKLNLFRAQFDDPSDADLREPCAAAILDAADGAGRVLRAVE